MPGLVHPSAEELLATVQRHGTETTSFQVLEEGTRYWSDGGEGLVAFTDTGRAWVSAGAPLCPSGRMGELAEAFVHAARAKGRRAAFCAVEATFPSQSWMRTLPFGTQPVWDPNQWPETLKRVRSLREQLRRARAKKVRVRLLEPLEMHTCAELRKGLERLTLAWLSSKNSPPLSFLVDVQLFGYAEQRRTFIAEQDNVPVGLLSAIPIPGRGGWFFEDILRAPDAPNGTTELLVDAAMTRSAQEGSAHVTMGLVPLSGELPAWLRMAKSMSGYFYDFEGLNRFREKLRPTAREAVRIVYPETQNAVTTAWDVLSAFTQCSPVVYALGALQGRFRKVWPAPASAMLRAQ
jgi:phosphatidylglycerol lysyltransferase